MKTSLFNIMVVATILSKSLPSQGRDKITQPSQPSSGPGSSEYSCASVVEHSYGKGDSQYWLLEPANPKPASAPVVIFNHGWSAMTPYWYRAWLQHIVRRGNIVIYPRYQATLRTLPDEMSSNAIAATKDALSELQSGAEHVKPMLDKVSVLGHSAGGNISAGMAARADKSGLPMMRAVMCVEPGKAWGPQKKQIPLDDVSAMPASTLLITIVGDQDEIVRAIDARRIIKETVLVPSENKNYVKVISDEHGTPPLIANHFFPAAPSPDPEKKDDSTMIKDGAAVKANALDYYVTWKLFDALQDAACFGKNKDIALGNTSNQKFTGRWSDGVPVKELQVKIGGSGAFDTTAE